MSIFGDLERAMSDLYPYRVPLTLGAVLVLGVAAAIIIRRGWHLPLLRWVDANRVAALVAAVLFLGVTLPVGYYLVSPLWERTTLIEASPLDSLDVAATSADSVQSSVSPTPAPDASSATPTPDAASRASAGEATSTPVATATSESTETPGAGATGPRLVSQGPFEGADDFHFARGQALIIEAAPDQFVLRFEEFSIRNGPDLYVYLTSDPEEPSADAVRLGRLKATDGAFNYDLPPGTNVSTLRYAMVWCDQFAVRFATAPLGR